MPDIGVPELLIVAVIVILLFGPGKAAGIGQSLGQSIREFRKASREGDEQAPGSSAQIGASVPAPSFGRSDAPASAEDVPPRAAASASKARYCTECGGELGAAEKFCTRCGAPAVTPAR